MKPKIKAMHDRFGVIEDKKCKDCENFAKFNYRSMKLKKCRCYGLTHSSASDWNNSYTACGLFNKSYDGKRIIELIKHQKRPRKDSVSENEQIKGQIAIFDILDNGM